ncbi:glycoside hydrolase family 16 protein [Stigmatella sp. ncwal1]|uniref:Glycoside hydrolase family 16 protein n=1 Tax=Stigmatella ashevillensis TaxID=2995309 RepID=A0ABT5D6A7_9BACT|nr:glycoside hydrolase family 16 protein [Stigmatella ashevillena]MDC0708635.1 glycoside hydrolase family 16 protein [Stigmatella ashevillena]
MKMGWLRFSLCSSALLLAGSPLAAVAAPAFTENWAASTSPYFYSYGGSQNTAISNSAQSGTTDGKALQFKLAANPAVGVGGGITKESSALYKYGTFTTRLKTTDCSSQPNTGVVTGFFTYFNDGGDYNGNGLPDNSEIDFEWLCAEPQVIYLTMYTDFAAGAHRRVSRILNLATGTIHSTCYYESFSGNCQALGGNENLPSSIPALAGYNSSTAYYEYGFTWRSNRVTWWIVNPANGQKITLWDYQGPASRIPANGSHYLTNIWHTNDWTPPSRPSATQPPNSARYAYVDWTAYVP